MTAESTAPDDHQSLVDPTFTVVRRGFDQSEVRRALIGLAGDLRAAQERELLLARQLADAMRRAEAVDPLDPTHLTKLLGDEVARILDAARAAAAQIRARADEAATRLFEETKAEAAADAAAVIERAELEAREILRLARERSGVPRGDPTGDPTGDPVGESGVDSVSETGITVGSADRTRPPTQQRSGRSGVDSSRTAGLFASLREQQAAQPAPRSASPRPAARPKKSPEKTSISTKAPDPEPTSAGPAVETQSVKAPRTQVPGDAGATSPVAPVVGSLSSALSRTIRRTLTDDLNALLADLPGSRGRGGVIMVPLDPEVGPTVAHHAERLRVSLDDMAPSIDRMTAVDLAESLAEAIVVPLRARIEDILAASPGDPGEVPAQLRGCFRQYRSEFVDPAVRSVLTSTQR
jgi:hypothetical protein